MKVEGFDAADERLVLTACLTNKDVLARVAARHAPPMCASRAAETVLGWCVDHYNRYGDAPRGAAEAIYADWAKRRHDKASAQLIEALLSSLSGEYERLGEEVNVGHATDAAARYFDRARLARARDALEAALAVGDVAKGQEALEAALATRANLAGQDGADILTDEAEIDSAFVEVQRGVVAFDGALGQFYRDTFARGCFVSFLAVEGVGKSFFLLDLAWRALLQRKRVAFFECGDLGPELTKLRFYARACGRPYRAGAYRVPTSLAVRDSAAEVSHEEKDCPEDLGRDEAKRRCAKIMRNKVRSAESYLKLSCHDTGTLTVARAKSALESWARRGWVADVVVFDYADIMAPSRRYEKKIDEVEGVWVELRGLALAHHCCVVTATQATRGGYKDRLLGKEHVSDCKKKTAQVSALVGINQSDEEQDKGTYRLNFPKLRGDRHVRTRVVHVASCLATSEPCLLSSF